MSATDKVLAGLALLAFSEAFQLFMHELLPALVRWLFSL